ncbi:MAG: hypothetical protein HQ596_08340 [Candidatus Saganbacteria bacterium]|nr:hypothetical protein [Candidatus Saganbacteria bacterium]
MLITKLNARSENLLPQAVRLDLRHRIKKKSMDVLKARDILLSWAIGSMPQIAKEYGVEGQELDGIQHYRFGFVQAENLIRISGTKNFAEDPEKKMIALFTSIHDIGRMMVGSGASKDIYGAQGNFFHPIVGAMMLREAFEPLMRELTSDVATLLDALVTTAERHTLSIGLVASYCENQRLSQLNASPYSAHKDALLMADVEMGKYGKYAHLVALADLINNPSVKGLPGVSVYDSLAGVEGMGTEERIAYLMHGPGTGNFRVVKQGEQEYTNVERIWRNKPPQDTPENWQIQIKRDATQFLKTDTETASGKDAFARGWIIALA